MSEFRHLNSQSRATLYSIHQAIRLVDRPLAIRFQRQILDPIEEARPELNIHEGRILVATDGSLRAHSSGRNCAAAACVYTLEDSRLNRTTALPVAHDISILTAEITALLAAILVAREENYVNILVIADSKSTIDKFNVLKTTGYRPSVANNLGTTFLEKQLWQAIAHEAKAINVIMRHIRSHQAGPQSHIMRLNTKADENAKAKMQSILQRTREKDGIALERPAGPT